jgi:cell wall-associated NlpC family hydrolase
MATSGPVALGIGGVAAVLIISGIQGKSLGDILKGDFGTTPDPQGPGTEGGVSENSTVGENASPAVVGRTTSSSREKILRAAASQLGVKYLWGGESEKNGFDCSGLTQWAYAQGGVKIPRTAQEQYNYMRHVSSPSPGDLVFFGSSKTDVSHVGIVTAPGMMEDAPHTGAVVRYEPYPPRIGASWGSDKVIGYGQA